MKHQPPYVADRFLEWYCKPELLEDLQGDLYEIYHDKLDVWGPGKAAAYYYWLVLRSFRWSAIRRLNSKTTTSMTQNHFKIAWRIMRREKLNAFLNISSLAIGIACFLLIGFYAKKELTYDSFHSRKNDIYRVWVKEDYGEGRTFFNSSTPLVFKEVLESNFPQIEHVVQYNIQNRLVGEGESKINEPVAIISPEFFDVFDFDLVKGENSTVLSTPNSLVLSESYAQKYFGDEPAMGKMIPMMIGNDPREFIVSGVYRDMPDNSGIQFDMAISGLLNRDIYGERSLTNWFYVSPESYVLLQPDADIATLEEQLPDIVMDNLGDEVNRGEYVIGFQKLTDIHLDPTIPPGIVPVGNRDQVYILSAICLLIVIIASINYAMLAIGQSFRRTREVGIRKVMGAFKSTLVQQYLAESFLTVFFATLLGILIANLLLPLYNELTGAAVDLAFSPWHILLYAGLIMVLGIISGIYPSLILARWNIVAILKGNHKPARHRGLRRGMVIFQFVVTVLLISCSLIMYQQMNYMMGHDPGYDYSATVVVPLNADPTSQSFFEVQSSAMDRGTLLKEKLTQYPEISKVGMGSHVFGSAGWAQIAFPDEQDAFHKVHLLIVDPYYFETFGIQLTQGRAMDPDNPADARQAIILNEAAVREFGLTDPVGSRLPNPDFEDHQIIGVTADFNYESLHVNVDPLVITSNPRILFPGITDAGFPTDPTPKLVFKYTGPSLLNVKEVLESSWKEVFPEEELSFSFVEENMQSLYASEIRMQRLVLLATILSIVIASLGLLGLTVIMVNSRIKEISIRKIVGASEKMIYGMLVKNVAVQLLIAILLAVPVAYFLMSDWLNEFAYHIKIGPGVFVISAVLSLLVVLAVVSYHTWLAARTNPSDTLRSE